MNVRDIRDAIEQELAATPDRLYFRVVRRWKVAKTDEGDIWGIELAGKNPKRDRLDETLEGVRAWWPGGVGSARGDSAEVLVATCDYRSGNIVVDLSR